MSETELFAALLAELADEMQADPDSLYVAGKASFALDVCAELFRLNAPSLRDAIIAARDEPRPDTPRPDCPPGGRVIRDRNGKWRVWTADAIARMEAARARSCPNTTKRDDGTWRCTRRPGHPGACRYPRPVPLLETTQRSPVPARKPGSQLSPRALAEAQAVWDQIDVRRKPRSRRRAS